MCMYQEKATYTKRCNIINFQNDVSIEFTIMLKKRKELNSGANIDDPSF